MSSLYIVFGVISVLFGSIVYVAISDYIIAIVVTFVSIVYFFVLACPKIRKYNDNKSRFHECYRFINNFIISLSVRGSLIQSFESVETLMTKEYFSIINSVKDQSEVDKLHYLERYFPFHIYSIFVTLVMVWLEEGGDILYQTKSLLEEAKNNESILINSERIFKKKIIEFITLWAFSIVVVIVLRFALIQFYDKISNQLFYKVSIGVFFLIILLSVEILIRRGTETNLKGWNR